MSSDEVAVALLKAHNEVIDSAVCVKIADNLADIFEAGQHVNELRTVFFADFVNKLCRNKGFNYHGMLRESAERLSL